MKKRNIVIFAILFFLVAQFASAKVVTVAGAVKEKEYLAKNFNKISVQGQFNIYLTQGEEQKVNVVTYENLIPYVKVSQANGILSVKLDERITRVNWKNHESKLDLFITAKNPETIKISGSCELYAKTDIKTKLFSVIASGAIDVELLNVYAESINIKVSGASDVETGIMKASVMEMYISGAGDVSTKMNIENFKLKISGSSEIVAYGEADKAIIDMSGASELKGRGLSVNKVMVKGSGSSDCQLTVNKEISARLSGASSLEYLGEANLTSIVTSGVSSIRRVK